MARAKISAGRALRAKKKSKFTFERVAILTGLVIDVVILLKLFGVI